MTTSINQRKAILSLIAIAILISFATSAYSASCDDNDPPTQKAGEDYMNPDTAGYAVYESDTGDGIKYDHCEGEYDLVEAHCDGDYAQRRHYTCPSGEICRNGACISDGTCFELNPDCHQCTGYCDSCLDRGDGDYCDCADECSSGICCNNKCSDTECGASQSCDWSDSDTVGGTSFCADIGKITYSLEETCKVEITADTGYSTSNPDVKVELYTTSTSGTNMDLDRSVTRHICEMESYDTYDMCWPAAGNCPATTTYVLTPGHYQAQPLLTDRTGSSIPMTATLSTCVKKIKCADCSDPSSKNYCDLCSHCADGVQNCGESCIDGGTNCIYGTETSTDYVPYFELGNKNEMYADDYDVDDFQMFFSSTVFCHDGIDNDKDCLVDSDDPDCTLTSTDCMDSDGDGYGIGPDCKGHDCDDTDPSLKLDECDTTPPEVTLVINNDDHMTQDPDVILNLTYDDDKTPDSSLECDFSNDNITYDGWESCQETVPWTLEHATGSGLKEVYVKIKDQYDNINNSVMDKIHLDLTIGDNCTSDSDCYSNSCRKEIDSDDYYCTIPGMNCSEEDADGFVSGETKNSWICEAKDKSVNCTDSTRCYRVDYYNMSVPETKFCNISDIWTPGNGLGQRCNETDHCRYHSGYWYTAKKCNGMGLCNVSIGGIDRDSNETYCLKPDPGCHDTHWIERESLCCNDDLNEIYKYPYETVDKKEACIHKPSECVLFGVAFHAEDDETNMKDDKNQSCYNTNWFRGFCNKTDWQTDPDGSPDTCCCIGSGFWSSHNQCCNEGDEWLNDDLRWACMNGAALGNYTGGKCNTNIEPKHSNKVVTYACDKIRINDTEYWWNQTHWINESPNYCGCSSDADCEDGYECLRNICMVPRQTSIDASDKIVLFAGDTKETIITFSNHMNISDNVKVTIGGDIDSWAWFKGQKRLDQHEKVVSVASGSNSSHSIEVFGGDVGVYDMDIDSESLLTGIIYSHEITVEIIPRPDDDTPQSTSRQTPGISYIAMIAIAFAATMIYIRKI